MMDSSGDCRPLQPLLIVRRFVKMAKKKQSVAMPVKDAMFFPEDFTRLHRRHVIYIKQGVIIDLDKLR
jgi:hypothetical protein